MSKKLVQINVVCNGSTGRIMNQISDKAIEQGWEVYNFYGRGKSNNKNCIKIGNKIDILFHVLLTRLFDKTGYGSKSATKKMIRQIKSIDPDVIQLHNIHGYYLNLKILFKYLKECNKKVVWTFHDCWAFTGHCTHFICPKCDKWKSGCKGKCIRRKDYPSSIFRSNAEKNYKLKKELFLGIDNLTIVTPSKWLEQLVRQSFFKNFNVEVINNGIDLNIFKPTYTVDIREKYNIPVNKKIILGVAAVWSRTKGLEDFIKLSEYLEKEYVILLVGLNKKQIRQLPSNIIGIERTENVEELANLYTQADCFVNPTWEDNFPTTNLESLACGTPVITFNIGGSPESINETCGLVVEKGNIEDLINAINGFNREQYVGCLKQSKNYDKGKQYKKYIELYKKVIK